MAWKWFSNVFNVKMCKKIEKNHVNPQVKIEKDRKG